MRHPLMSALALLLAVAASAGAASAHGVTIRGQELFRATTTPGQTGDCNCVWKWYTFGVKPGELRISASITGYHVATVGSYGLRLYLYRGKTAVRSAQLGCSTKQPCRGTAHLTYRVPRRGVYYLRVEGPGAVGVSFSLTVRGKLYRAA